MGGHDDNACFIVHDIIEGMQFFYCEMFVHCGTWRWCM